MISDKKYNVIYADPPWKFKYFSKSVTEGNPDNIPFEDYIDEEFIRLWLMHS